ncbi:MAG: Fic family protein [Lactobacillaceae bacterium]|jgi:prophage maintenance system killer protein|nr:Fic family protein [Lactobacillaceae bacterium]
MSDVQYKFDKKIEEMLFKKSIPQILHDGVQFENLLITLLQTQQIVNNEKISGISTSDMLVVHDMHKGAEYILNEYADFDFEKLKVLHSITGRDDAFNPGQLRTSAGGFNTTKGTFTPDAVEPAAVEKYFNQLLADTELTPEAKASKIFTYLSRAQLFNDTNKRTAVLAANVPLLQHGAGVFYIPEAAMENVLHLMGEFYHSNDDRVLVAVLMELAISDFDGKTYYAPEHQAYEYANEHQTLINTFKGLGAKGLLGKQRVEQLLATK